METQPHQKRAFNLTQALATVTAFTMVAILFLLTGSLNKTPSEISATHPPMVFEISARNMTFSPNVLKVPASVAVKISFTNHDTMAHDLVAETGVKTPLLKTGESAILDLGVVSAPLKAWCSVAGHRQAGMEIQIIPEGDTLNSSPHTATPHHQNHSNETAWKIPGMQAFLQNPSNVYVDPVLPPVKVQTSGRPLTHRVTLTVTEKKIPIGADVMRPIWTFNGGPVGPTLRGKIGDKFIVTLKNAGSMAHSIDFHASFLAPDKPMRSIQPGEELVYEFTAQRAGIWLYHCSTTPMSMHIAAGMYGAVIVDPEDLTAVDYEYVMVQSEVYLPSEDSPVSVEKLQAVRPDLMAFNGVPYQYRVKPLEVTVGSRVRVWILAAGPNLGTSFHVVGSQFDSTWAEGRYLLKDGIDPVTGTHGNGSQTLALSAAQGGFVEFTLPESGSYAFVDHSMVRAEQGAVGLFHAK